MKKHLITLVMLCSHTHVGETPDIYVAMVQEIFLFRPQLLIHTHSIIHWFGRPDEFVE